MNTPFSKLTNEGNGCDELGSMEIIGCAVQNKDHLYFPGPQKNAKCQLRHDQALVLALSSF